MRKGDVEDDAALVKAVRCLVTWKCDSEYIKIHKILTAVMLIRKHGSFIYFFFCCIVHCWAGDLTVKQRKMSEMIVFKISVLI